MEKRHFFSIKYKMITAYATMILLTILFFSIVLFYSSEKTVFQLAKKNADQTVFTAFQTLNMKIDNINSCMLSVQTNREVQDILCRENPASALKEISVLERCLTNTDTFQNNISKLELYVLDRSDYPPVGSSGRVFSAERMKNDPWFKNVLANGSSTTWSVRNTNNESNSFIIASKLITDVTINKPVAVLKASINLREFTKVTDNILLMDTGRLFLCSANNIINYSDSELGMMLANHNTIFNDMLRSGSNETRRIKLNGEEYLISSYPIKNTGIFLVGAAKIKEFRSSRITSALVVTALLLIVLSSCFVWFISRTITKPLSELTDEMQCYTPDKSHILRITSNDEIGVLQSQFNNMQIRIKNLINNIKREISVRRRAELKALQAQITPHFIYNALNSICILAKKYDAGDIQKMVMALSDFFRISLSDGAEIITLEQEILHVESYVRIQKVRYKDKFEVCTDIDETLLNNLICKLTVQPLVENCINHAFCDMEEKGIINISAKRDGEDLVITVSDNGPDIADIDELNRYVKKDFDLEESVEKYGIHNINQRIHIYFGEEYSLSYRKNEPNGLSAVIRIRAITEEEKFE